MSGKVVNLGFFFESALDLLKPSAEAWTTKESSSDNWPRRSDIIVVLIEKLAGAAIDVASIGIDNSRLNTAMSLVKGSSGRGDSDCSPNRSLVEAWFTVLLCIESLFSSFYRWGPLRRSSV